MTEDWTSIVWQKECMVSALMTVCHVSIVDHCMGHDNAPVFCLSWLVSCDIMVKSPLMAIFLDVDVKAIGSRVIFCILEVFPVFFLCSRRSCGTS